MPPVPHHFIPPALIVNVPVSVPRPMFYEPAKPKAMVPTAQAEVERNTSHPFVANEPGVRWRRSVIPALKDIV